MAINSNEKGKRSEREFKQLLVDLGFPGARRTAQYCGNSGDASDVTGVDGLHIEVKRCERLSLHEWLKQAERDSEDTEDIPCVFFRRSREPWYVVMPAIDFLQIYKGVKENGTDGKERKSMRSVRRD